MLSQGVVLTLAVQAVADCSTCKCKASKEVQGQIIHSECGNLVESDCCLRCQSPCVASQVNTTGCCTYFSSFSGTTDNSESTAIFTGAAPTPAPTPQPTPQPTPTPGGDPTWGCGLVGALPGINADGSTTADTQRLIDGVKGSSTYNKVNYWNWNFAPEEQDGVMQYLSKDFIFMPEQWGAGVVHHADLQQAGQVGIKDMSGGDSPATMGTILLGMNEPDQTGSCMGNLMGQCTRSCTDDEIQADACPVAHLKGATPSPANPVGHCDCWSDSHATGVGFWSLANCQDPQPLPNLFNDSICVNEVRNAWKVTADIAVKKGYKFLSTPLVAWNMDWLRSFIQTACDGCSDISCGCPTHIGWHFYASDCRPVEQGSYTDFQNKLDKTAAIMEEFPHIQGAIVNEVGMLNCAYDGKDGACIPNGPNQKYPADKQPGHVCPNTDELPNGLGTFIEHLLGMVASAKTSDGRRVVKSFAWFNENMSGGTYDLRLFDDSGNVNNIGESFIKGCSDWAASIAADKVVV